MTARKHNLLVKLFLLLVVVGFIIKVLFSLIFFPVEPKTNPELLRIGYLNLHKSALSKADLAKMASFDCDLWLFLEWKGDNLEADPGFLRDYKKVFEANDELTFGCAVFGQRGIKLKSKEFDDQQKYVCDYPKIIVESEDFQIAFLHAPPPVPSCSFETIDYIEDAMTSFGSIESLDNQVIIGDLNTLPYSKGYRKIRAAGFRDAFGRRVSIAGTFGFFPGFPKFLRIDYCFVKGDVDVSFKRRFNVRSSDHCGLVMDLLTNGTSRK